MQLTESEWTDYRSKKGSDRIQIILVRLSAMAREKKTRSFFCL
jgi:hypothetical protein